MSKKSKKPQATTAVAAAVNAIAIEPDSLPGPQFSNTQPGEAQWE